MNYKRPQWVLKQNNVIIAQKKADFSYFNKVILDMEALQNAYLASAARRIGRTTYDVLLYGSTSVRLGGS